MYGLAGSGQDNVGRERDQLGRLFSIGFDIGSAPAILDPHVVPLGPAQLSQGFDERLNAGPTFWIVFGEAAGEPTNTSQALVLLRARRERPGSRAAKKRDELAPPHGLTQSPRTTDQLWRVRPVHRSRSASLMSALESNSAVGPSRLNVRITRKRPV